MKSLKPILFATVVCLAPAMAFAASDAVNVNKASKQELMDGLQGITSQQADAIVQYRNKEGAIVHLNELDTIKGVDRKLIEPNYSRLTVGDVNWGDKKS